MAQTTDVSGTQLNNQAWTNPITGKRLNVPSSWSIEDLRPGDAQIKMFRFASNSAAYVFSYNPLPNSEIDISTYAAAVEENSKASVSVNSEWRPVVIGGQQGLQASMFYKENPTQNLKITVAIAGKGAWTLVSSAGAENAALAVSLFQSIR